MTNEERKQLIGEAIGEASMCWCETPTGIFDSTRASKIVDRVTAALEAERVGEVVLETLPVGSNGYIYLATTKFFVNNPKCKGGKLIFRPEAER